MKKWILLAVNLVLVFIILICFGLTCSSYLEKPVLGIDRLLLTLFGWIPAAIGLLLLPVCIGLIIWMVIEFVNED